jgi:RNA polymerase sigma-70 factor (ECF subfamily)
MAAFVDTAASLLVRGEGRLKLIRPAAAGSTRAARRGGRATRGMDDDDDLMARIAAGDHAAFTALVGRHLDRVLAVAQRVLGERAEAEDVAQEALLRVWRLADRWRPGEARISTWLYRVAVNLCLDRKRRPQPAPLEAAGDPADPAPDAFARLYRDEAAALVAAEIAKLPERQRAALALSYYEDLSNTEAAEILQVSVGALESLLVRARRTLAERLGPALGPALGPGVGPRNGGV